MTEVVSLGEVAKVFNGKTPAKDEQRDNGYPVLKIRDVSEDGQFRGSFASFVELDFAKRHESKKIRTGDIMILNAAHNAEYVGSKQFKASSDVEGAVATGEWLIARSTDSRLDQDYLWHWFQSPPTRFSIKQKVKGIHLYPRDVAQLAIPLLPLQAQRRIAAILNKAEAIRKKREAILAAADDLLRSLFVYGVGYLNQSYADWPTKRIEELAEDRKGSMRTGPFGSALLHSEFVDEGIAVLGIDNAVKNCFAWGERRFITAEKYDELRRYRVFPSDVIVTIMGTTGRSAVVPDGIPEAITTKHLATITCDRSKVMPEFLAFAIHSDPHVIRQIEKANKGAIMDGLSLSIIRKIEINLPPLEMQEEFVQALRNLMRLKERSTSTIGSGADLYASVSQRAFAGGL